MTAPFSADELRVLQAEWDAEADMLQADDARDFVAEEALRAFARRTERILMPTLLATAGTLGAVCLVAQIVNWVGA